SIMGDFNLEQFATIVKDTITQNQQQYLQAVAQATSVARTPPVKVRDPPTYDGLRDAMIIDDWITAIENQQEFFGWDDVVTYKFASNYLTGRAGQWHQRLKKEANPPTTWPSFKGLLVSKYRPDNADLLARDLLA
ncbi:hypothetical protein ABG067_008323, partial [Albugo candida]